jgi:hypothetical protein
MLVGAGVGGIDEFSFVMVRVDSNGESHSWVKPFPYIKWDPCVSLGRSTQTIPDESSAMAWDASSQNCFPAATPFLHGSGD